ncbi:LuxR C-terminal-related transcriptional regulator [Leucobacter sp. wl10]|uniref:helix-turn-helix transcriptional regulator n=1 Tax=Leucobacter sp. wl10 TaxID=2304677 RepID=UPI0013C33D43|nr:LuxR C-terminal-related transcriptional regulator [Leucobacter sp. wl10]
MSGTSSETWQREDFVSLNDVTAVIDSRFEAGDYAGVAELLSDRMMEAWFGGRPEHLLSRLGALERELGELPPMLRAIQLMARPVDNSAIELNEPVDLDAVLSSAEDPAYRSLATAAVLFGLRMQGRPVEAWRLGIQLAGKRDPLQPLFDRHRGWVLFGQVQMGLSTMLAGRFNEALGLFAEAQLHVTVPTLPFLTRDAYVKAAVIQSSFGDTGVARSLLEIADRIPRTDSWAEDAVDASASIVRALIADATPRETLAELDAIPLHHVGEMWPFYVHAIQQACERADARLEALERLKRFEATALPRVVGQGYSGSVIQGSLAANFVMLGNTAAARDALELADPDLPTTQIVWGMLFLTTGRPDLAVQHARRAGAGSKGLRQLELWRLSLLSNAFLQMNDADGCVEAARNALALPGGLDPEDMPLFARDVRRLAAAELEGWPDEPETESPHVDELRIAAGALSARETQVLRLLVAGRSREQIAKELFLSENTVKTHQRSVYRKLGVSSKGAALVEAERRGLI